MTLGQMIAFVLFALTAAGTPGPSNLILTATGATVGVVRGLPALLGQVVGMGLLLFLVAVGLGSLVVRSPLIVQGLKWFGIGFLLWLAWQMATAEHRDQRVVRAQVGFWTMAGFQWVNPKAWLVCVTAVGVYLPAAAGTSVTRSVVLALLFMLTALPSCLVWLAAGARVQRLLQTERAWRIFSVVMGGLLAASMLLFIR